jgi:hypothetical protein
MEMTRDEYMVHLEVKDRSQWRTRRPTIVRAKMGSVLHQRDGESPRGG